MDFFWVGMLRTYFLGLLSFAAASRRTGPRLWRIFYFIAMEYITLVYRLY